VVRVLFQGTALGNRGFVAVTIIRDRLVKVRNRPGTIRAGVGRVQTIHADIAILAGRGDHVVASDIPGCPRNVSHQPPVASDLNRGIEFFLAALDAQSGGDDLARAVHLDGVHPRNNETQRVRHDARAQRRIARLRVRVEAHLEGYFLSATRLRADGELVDGDVFGQVLRLFVLEDGEPAVGGEEGEVRMAILLVVLDAEGAVGGPGGARAEGGAAGA
jgi:hypothetical protein